MCEFDVGYVGLMEWEDERKRGKIEMGEKEGIDFFYIICWYSLYNFNNLYVKIETGMLGEL